MRTSWLWTVLGLGGLLAGSSPAADEAYDPLASGEPTGEPLDLVVHDASRDRDLPILVYLPHDPAPAPVVLFSHGLGGSRFGSAYLGRHWSARGYVAVFCQHPGSDTSVWRDQPLGDRMRAMNSAANNANFQLRVKDIPAVLDQLAVWHEAAEHPLHGRLDLERVGMSGHSFGAITTQAVSGQTFPLIGARYTDPRIDAALPMSPSSPRVGRPEAAFGQVAIPWLLMTGTHDVAIVGDIPLESRLAVYPALPPGGKYELVLDQAEHSVFTESRLPGERLGRNPNHHQVILALSTAFWDALLREDAAARAWLDGDGPRQVMEPADRWQRK